MGIIEPTVGRIVHYYGYSESPNTHQPMAAVITAVHSTLDVSLCVFQRTGNPHPLKHVTLVQGEAIPDGGHFCRWMPYQVGQAAKSEQLEEQLTKARGLMGGSSQS